MSQGLVKEVGLEASVESQRTNTVLNNLMLDGFDQLHEN